MDCSRRCVVLGTLATIGVAGCLEDGGTPGDPNSQTPANQSGEQTPTATPETADSPSTGTPQSTPKEDGDSTPNEDSTPTDDEGTPTDGKETPTPPDDVDDSKVFPGYEMTNVAVRTPGEKLLGWVRAAIADTSSVRYTGLSDTESLPENYGMLFVYEDVDERTFVMRRMDFGIDIVYADADGVITTIHHAPEPGPDEDGSEQRYPGRGQYILEVNKHWTTDRGVEEGDVLEFELPE